MLSVSSSVLAHDLVGLMNSTGETIYSVYFVPSSASNWGPNRLNGKLLTGNLLRLDASGSRYWSLRVYFANNKNFYWNNLDTELRQIIIIAPNGKGGYQAISN